MPQTKSGRKKWRKKQRNLMEAAMANQSNQVVPPVYPVMNFVPPVPILQPPPPTSKPAITNSLFTFTPIVPSNPLPQQSKPSVEVTNVKKKTNGFDLPDNCPNSLR